MVLKHYLQRSVINNIRNFWFGFRLWQRNNRNTQPQPGPAGPPSDYSLIFQDKFTELNWEAWRTGHPWGRNVHTDWQWKWWPHRSELTKYPMVETTEAGLQLHLKKFKRTFSKSMLPRWQMKNAPESWSADWAMGCISSRKAYKFGWFEAEIKIPKGQGQWAAFWLSGQNSWPPEIDVFETYGRKAGARIDIKPNVHFGSSSNDWREGKRDFGQAKIQVKDASERWVKYAVHWTADFIRFYYDGYLVQECTIPAALKQNADLQYIILNHGCENPERLGFDPTEGTMHVRNVKVYQQNKI